MTIRKYIQEDDSSYFDKHIEVQSLNKPAYWQLKRVWRMAKKIPNPDKPKKKGFYLQGIRKTSGDQKVSEKIVHSVFGNSQEMSPKKFIAGIFKYEAPEEKKFYVKPETAYQTTQRLIAGKEEVKDPSLVKTKKAILNKTISVSVFGDIYSEILDKYRNKPDGDNIIRSINRHISSHFTNAAGFIRWTQMRPDWIHIDAFQTDFFGELKRIAREDEIMKPVVEDFRKKEFEFFKTAFSYVVRSNPKVKVWTVSTEDIVKAVEHVRGDVKLKEYYHKLPKALGFKLMPMDDFFNKVLRTRPGKETEKIIKKFGGAVKGIMGKNVGSINFIDKITDINSDIHIYIATQKKEKKGNIEKETLDRIISSVIEDFIPEDLRQRFVGAYHQHLDELFEIVNKIKKQKLASGKERAINVKTFLNSKTRDIEKILKSGAGVGSDMKIWWANRQLLYETTEEILNNFIEELTTWKM